MSATGSPTNTASNLSPRRRWTALGVLSASLIVITMDMTVLNIALPEMAADLHPTSDQQLWIIDIYSLVLAGLLVVMAAIGDRWGRRRMLSLGYGIFAIASLLILLADTAADVIAIRAFLAVGGAMIMPTTLSLIRVIFSDPGERATALSIWASVSGLGLVIGPLVGGFLIEHFSWHAAFLINVPLMVAGVVAATFLLPESRSSNPGPLDLIAAVLSLVGMTALVWGIKKFGVEASFAVPRAWLAMAVAGATLSWFTLRNLKAKHPLLDLRLFGSRQFSAGILAALGSTFSMVAALLLVAQWLQLVDGATPIEAGIKLMPIAVAGSAASLVAPPLSRVIGARAVLALGITVAAVGLLHIGLTGDRLNLQHMIFALCLVGVGMGALAIGSALIMGGVPTDKAGNAGALEETSYELGATLGVAILGSVSAIVFRSAFTKSEQFSVLQALDKDLAAQAKESLGAAMAITNELGLPELSQAAADAFDDSLQLAGFVGGLIMLGVALAVFLLVPKGTSLDQSMD